MSKPESLVSEFQPQLVTWHCDHVKSLLAAEEELRRAAQHDANGCYGYFPAMQGNTGIDTNLPACQTFAQMSPSIALAGKNLQFNFMRLSLVRQKGDSPFHLDSDAATALTGDTTTICSRLVWRLLLNLSSKHARTLAYLNVTPASVPLSSEGGYIHCQDKNLAALTAKHITVPPRKDGQVSGVLFCASRVLHAGQDDQYGHFVAGYGCETAVPT